MKTVSEILNKDFAMEHIFIGLQRSGEENIIKRASGFDGIESYLMIKWEEENKCCYVKITLGILSGLKIYANEAWEQAERNTNKETKIVALDQMLNEMIGIEGCVESMPLFVVTNKSNNRGASAILNRSALAEFGRKHNIKKAIVMPSSIHEMLLFPYEDKDNIEDYINMVKDINESKVLPEEQLADQAYIITL